MEPAPLDPAELLRRLRQQLILAQVRVMEIEDERDATATRLADTERLLADAQRLADAKLDEAAHLERTLAELQKQFQHLRHVQHVTNQALEEARARLATVESALVRETAARAELAAALSATTATLDERAAALRTAASTAATHAARIAELDAERRALKSSRSWRWTAWLRALERAFGPRR